MTLGSNGLARWKPSRLEVGALVTAFVLTGLCALVGISLGAAGPVFVLFVGSPTGVPGLEWAIPLALPLIGLTVLIYLARRLFSLIPLGEPSPEVEAFWSRDEASSD